jgi:hypothetical protein
MAHQAKALATVRDSPSPAAKSPRKEIKVPTRRRVLKAMPANSGEIVQSPAGFFAKIESRSVSIDEAASSIPMKRNESRASETIDDAGARAVGRQVHIVNGPLVWAAPRTAEGQRRFIVVAGTVVLEEGYAPPPRDTTPTLARHTRLEDSCSGSAEFASRR